MTNATHDIEGLRDRPADEVEITEEMVSAGVFALSQKCPMDFAFPAGGEDEAVEAVLKAGLEVLFARDVEST